jgi:hypothetical protein
VSNEDTLRKIHRRQVARLLDHLQRTGQSTPTLEQDVKRAFGYVFQDVEAAVQGHDKEKSDERDAPQQ